MSKLKKIILLFIIIFSLIVFNNTVNAFSKTDTLNTTYTGSPPFESENKDMMYCRQHGGSLHKAWNPIEYSRGDEKNMSDKLAYALYLANGGNITTKTRNTSVQHIIWARKYSMNEKQLGANENLLSASSKSVSLSSSELACVNKAKKYTKATKANTEFKNTSNFKVKENKNDYKLGPINLSFNKSDVCYINNIEITILYKNASGDWTEGQSIIVTETYAGKELKKVNSKKDFYLKTEKTLIDNAKKTYGDNYKIKIVVNMKNKIFVGKYAPYNAKRECQSMLKITVTSTDADFPIPCVFTPTPTPSGWSDTYSPQLVTVKYISEINGESILDKFPRAWVSVDQNKAVGDEGRYTVHQQNTSKLVLHAGDEIKYTIVVYNVGTADLRLEDGYYISKKKYNSDNIEIDEAEEEKQGYYESADGYFKWGINPMLSLLGQKTCGLIYDYPSENLEFVSGDKWATKNDVRVYPVLNDNNDEKKQLCGFDLTYADDGGSTNALQQAESLSNTDWMSNKCYANITYKVKGDTENNTEVYNTDNDWEEVENNDTVAYENDGVFTKYLYSISDDANGSVNETKYGEPTITVKEENPHRTYNISYKYPDVGVKNGQYITYGIRIYNIGCLSNTLKLPFIDEYSEGLDYVKTRSQTVVRGTKSSDAIVTNNASTRTITINPAGKGITLNGYPALSGLVPYYQILLTFKANYNPVEMAYVSNTCGNTINLKTYYDIEGKVWIDNVNAISGKTTENVDGLFSDAEKLAENVSVELVNKETFAVVQSTTTGSNGVYTFKDLPSRNISINPTTGEIIGSEFDVTDYYVRFTYNGQEYENVKFNAGNADLDKTFDAKSSYSSELNDYNYSIGTTRSSFNEQFSTIDSTNSTNLSLMDASRKNYNISTPASFKIQAYSGSGKIIQNPLLDESGNQTSIPNGHGGYIYYTEEIENGAVNVFTPYKGHVNLGLVKREFDLSMENRLKSMDVSINGDTSTIYSYSGETIQDTLKEEDVCFKESDYNYTGENELTVWVNYEVKIKNDSIKNFVGNLKSIVVYMDSNFSEIKVPGASVTIDSSKSSGPLNAYIVEFQNAKEIVHKGNTSIIVSGKLTRDKIAYAIQNEQQFDSLEMIAEIGSYSTTYGSDIFENGHTGNAGKIDEDSNAGDIGSIKYYYEKVRKSTDSQLISNFFAQDDAHRALRIKLRKDNNPRTMEGIVFEDSTSQKDLGDGPTRLGDGAYSQGEKTIDGVEVQLVDLSNNNNVIESVTTSNGGKYTISGFIPSTNYVVRFNYGDGKTGIYNAQDYKSTIDTIQEDYGVRTNNDTGNKYGWYADSQIENKSVAKDIDMKMNDLELTNKTATELEDYEKVEGNTASTNSIYVGLRWKGNNNSSSEEYNIKNINLGLAERPRSELTIVKEVDHINIVASDGSTLIDGTQGAKSVSWAPRYYVQPIVDESLIYGSTITITYKVYIVNTGEVSYNSAEFYNYGGRTSPATIVTTKANKVIDYIDNNLVYSSETKYYGDSNITNATYWEIEEKDADAMISEGLLENSDNSKEYYNSVSTKLKAKENTALVNKSLKPGEKTEDAYLTLSKVMSNTDTETLTYENYVEILSSTNTAGRRSYHTTQLNDNGIAEYNTLQLSDVENRGTPVLEKLENAQSKYLVLSIPGDLGDPRDSSKTTLGIEPDSGKAETVQVIQPFGDETNYKVLIWSVVGAISAIALAGGIFLIRKYALNNKQ